MRSIYLQSGFYCHPASNIPTQHFMIRPKISALHMDENRALVSYLREHAKIHIFQQTCNTDWYTRLSSCSTSLRLLTHWGRATHICVSKLTIIASDNGLSPGRCQAINWNNAGILSIGLLGTNFSEILIEILTIFFKKMRLKVLSAKWRPFYLGLNVLIGMLLLATFCAPPWWNQESGIFYFQQTT